MFIVGELSREIVRLTYSLDHSLFITPEERNRVEAQIHKYINQRNKAIETLAIPSCQKKWEW
jgi:hypothetical protein